MEESTNVIYFERHPNQPLSARARQELEALAAMPDEEIDYSDIPKQNPEDWADAQRFHDVVRPGKQVVAIALDPEVLSWLRAGGSGLESRVAEILHERMTAEQRTR